MAEEKEKVYGILENKSLKEIDVDINFESDTENIVIRDKVGSVGGSRNVALGVDALAGTGSQNVAVGTRALGSNSTGLNNTAVGYYTLAMNTTASGNTAVGS